MPREVCRTSSSPSAGGSNFPRSCGAAGPCSCSRSRANGRNSRTTLRSFSGSSSQDRSPREGSSGPARWSLGTRSSILDESVDSVPSPCEPALTYRFGIHLNRWMRSCKMLAKGAVSGIDRRSDSQVYFRKRVHDPGSLSSVTSHKRERNPTINGGCLPSDRRGERLPLVTTLRPAPVPIAQVRQNGENDE